MEDQNQPQRMASDSNSQVAVFLSMVLSIVTVFGVMLNITQPTGPRGWIVLGVVELVMGLIIATCVVVSRRLRRQAAATAQQ